MTKFIEQVYYMLILVKSLCAHRVVSKLHLLYWIDGHNCLGESWHPAYKGTIFIPVANAFLSPRYPTLLQEQGRYEICLSIVYLSIQSCILLHY